jgi:hypothetical protein
MTFSLTDREQQLDELLALDSIFGPEQLRKASGDRELALAIPSWNEAPRIQLSIHLPENYPSAIPPVFELQCRPSDALNDEGRGHIAHQLQSMFNPGEVVIFAWATWLQEEWERLAPRGDELAVCVADADAQLPASSGDKHAIASPSTLPVANPVQFISGEPLMEKKSTFQAHLAVVTTCEQVQAVMTTLLDNSKIRNATHPCIMAYRIERSGGQGFLQDYDDDGEKAAGSRLLHLLQLVDARNVVVVVSRWFGGVLLGPARFGLINRVARDLLEANNFITNGQGAEGNKKNK